MLDLVMLSFYVLKAARLWQPVPLTLVIAGGDWHLPAWLG